MDKKQRKLAANKKHKEENPEYYKNYNKKYYQKNKQKILNRSFETYHNPDKKLSLMLNSTKRRALKMNVEFDIFPARILFALLLGVCEKSGIPFDFKSSDNTWRNPYAPSIDRKDNFKGYTTENIQVVCNFYNTGKGQHTDEQFIAFCHAVAKKNPI